MHKSFGPSPMKNNGLDAGKSQAIAARCRIIRHHQTGRKFPACKFPYQGEKLKPVRLTPKKLKGVGPKARLAQW